jgi:hypothetical protein
MYVDVCACVCVCFSVVCTPVSKISSIKRIQNILSSRHQTLSFCKIHLVYQSFHGQSVDVIQILQRLCHTHIMCPGHTG